MISFTNLNRPFVKVWSIFSPLIWRWPYLLQKSTRSLYMTDHFWRLDSQGNWSRPAIWFALSKEHHSCVSSVGHNMSICTGVFHEKFHRFKRSIWVSESGGCFNPAYFLRWSCNHCQSEIFSAVVTSTCPCCWWYSSTSWYLLHYWSWLELKSKPISSKVYNIRMAQLNKGSVNSGLRDIRFLEADFIRLYSRRWRSKAGFTLQLIGALQWVYIIWYWHTKPRIERKPPD